MKTSESIKEIAAALAKAQGKIQNAKKDVTNTFFKSKYADLASIWDACREHLSANDLSIVQTTEPSEREEVLVITRLLHSSGEWIESRLALPVTKADAQGFGSAMTYARRYALSAIVGVAPDDDDGNLGAAAKPAKVQKNTDNGFGGTTPITATQEAVDAFDALPPETKTVIKEHAATLIHLFNTKGDLAGYIKEQDYDTEAELALWSQLPSLVRTAIKKQQTEKRALAEQA